MGSRFDQPARPGVAARSRAASGRRGDGHMAAGELPALVAQARGPRPQAGRAPGRAGRRGHEGLPSDSGLIKKIRGKLSFFNI